MVCPCVESEGKVGRFLPIWGAWSAYPWKSADSAIRISNHRIPVSYTDVLQQAGKLL